MLLWLCYVGDCVESNPMNSSESPVCLASALALARTDGAAAACARWPELAPHKSTLARVVVLEAVLQQAQQRVAEVAAEIDQLTEGLSGAGTGAGGLNCPAPFPTAAGRKRLVVAAGR